MTAVDELPPEELETVGSAGVPRRIYAYTLPGKDSHAWERVTGQTVHGAPDRSKSGTPPNPMSWIGSKSNWALRIQISTVSPC